MPHASELRYAAERVSTIEINGTFYSLQRPSSYAAWAESVPEGFVFSVKAPRFITHMRRLRDCRVPLANFLASGPLRLGTKLGPFLWQLPPSLPFEKGTLEAFLRLLPRTAGHAAALARRHDGHVSHGVWLKVLGDAPLRHALEVRHPSFVDPEFIALLRDAGVALVIADSAGRWPRLGDLTSDFVYVRLHGGSKLYESGYAPASLAAWEARLRCWMRGRNAPGDRLAGRRRGDGATRDAFVYFDNDVKTRAPFDAISLAGRLGAAAVQPAGGAEPLRRAA
jgi:uncharacterized protein YecE (DUF72 family)